MRPTRQFAGVAINDDSGLEREADVMGARLARETNAPVPNHRIGVEIGSNENAATRLETRGRSENGALSFLSPKAKRSEALFGAAVQRRNCERLDTGKGQANPAADVRQLKGMAAPVQRLTAGPPPPPHVDGSVRSTVHNITETKTNQSGVESDTGNFDHANHSGYLDSYDVIYKLGSTWGPSGL